MQEDRWPGVRAEALRDGRALPTSLRGTTLMEVLVVVSIMSLVAGGVTMYALPKFREAQVTTSETSARVLRQAVLDWQRKNDVQGCPTVDDLRAGQHIDSASEVRDAWGDDYVLTCLPDDVMVASLGPDRLPWSDDDIVIPDYRHVADPFEGGAVAPAPGWAPDTGISFEQWVRSVEAQAQSDAP